mmetsp:Transcript_27312/g.24094  ORF Transcript_27312/g.24094 Transcript_27312/m.24094 type:complete len:202 (-) Transcript_27312:65-670(-)
MKVRRYFESSEFVDSKEEMEVHVGFRTFNTKPIFSKMINGCTKTKYVKKTLRDEIYMASFYGEVTFPPANTLMFRKLENGNKELVAYGDLMQPDPLKVNLKRIILTGYPAKVHKRRAVIKMMFFNPEDVKYFQQLEVLTRNGLRGRILESLGTHGLMKCMFNQKIKMDDTVCIYLYKRVFPKWPFEPVEKINPSDILSSNF